MKKTHSRRDFLKVAGAVSAASFVAPQCFILAEEAKGANEKVALASIGAGGRGTDLFREFMNCDDARLVAVADCYQSRRTNLAGACEGKPFLDYHEFLDDPGIDAVIIATADHQHVPAAIAAAKAKKSAYVEKPLGLSIAENLMCEKVFAEMGVVFQYGTQQRSQHNCWLGCEAVRQGKIGKVVAIEVDAPNGGTGGDPTEAPIPDDLSEAGFRTWLGTAPRKPYSVDRCKVPGTYWIYDYSIGYLGGWGAHPLDIMVWGSDADLSGIVTVEGTAKIGAPLYDTVYDWDMNIMLGDVPLTFRTGGDRTKFIGETGEWITVSRGGTWASRDDLLAGISGENPILPQSHTNHCKDFVWGVKNNKTPVSHLRDAVRSDIISHLCDISIRTDSVVKWDPTKQELVDASDAQKKMIRREYA